MQYSFNVRIVLLYYIYLFSFNFRKVVLNTDKGLYLLK